MVHNWCTTCGAQRGDCNCESEIIREYEEDGSIEAYGKMLEKLANKRSGGAVGSAAV